MHRRAPIKRLLQNLPLRDRHIALRDGRDWRDGDVRPDGEDAIVDEPGGGVELGIECVDAVLEAERVVDLGWDGLEDGDADDGLC